jgi:hypothetical protein
MVTNNKLYYVDLNNLDTNNFNILKFVRPFEWDILSMNNQWDYLNILYSNLVENWHRDYNYNSILTINIKSKNDINEVWYNQLWKTFQQCWYSSWWNSEFKWFVYWDIFKTWNPNEDAFIQKSVNYNCIIQWWNVLRGVVWNEVHHTERYNRYRTWIRYWVKWIIPVNYDESTNKVYVLFETWPRI